MIRRSKARGSRQRAGESWLRPRLLAHSGNAEFARESLRDAAASIMRISSGPGGSPGCRFRGSRRRNAPRPAVEHTHEFVANFADMVVDGCGTPVRRVEGREYDDLDGSWLDGLGASPHYLAGVPDHDRHHRDTRLHGDVKGALLEAAEPRRGRAGSFRGDHQREAFHADLLDRRARACLAWARFPRSTKETPASSKNAPNPGTFRASFLAIPVIRSRSSLPTRMGSILL